MIAASSVSRQTLLPLLAGLVLLAPLPFGGVPPWAWSLFVVACCALGGVTLLDRGAEPRWQRLLGPVAACLALAALGLFQSLVPGQSLAPALTASTAAGWIAVASLFVAGAAVSRAGSAVVVLLSALLASAAFQMFYGLIQVADRSGTIWGREVSGPLLRLRGTFINSDHACLLFEVTLAVGLAWLWRSWKRRRGAGLESKVASFALPVLICIASLAAIFLTGSRAGVLAACVILATACLLAASRGRIWIAAAALAVMIGGLALATQFAPKSLWLRPVAYPVYELAHSERFEVWRLGAELWLDKPILGSGLGTFEEAFPALQSTELVSSRWGRAHNDFLELLVTGGLVGFMVLIAGLVTLTLRLWRVLREGARSASRAAAFAALCALPGLALHELFDFGLSSPGVLVPVVVLMAVAAASTTTSEAGAKRLQPRR